ncbi:hypothetical protein M0R45_018889 [Rubus argutus]|uniref:Uncharacterized protein n=1 Tax=Rubus argutus TaxID=59490 RepID=A0AAW1X4K9_RUBAR
MTDLVGRASPAAVAPSSHLSKGQPPVMIHKTQKENFVPNTTCLPYLKTNETTHIKAIWPPQRRSAIVPTPQIWQKSIGTTKDGKTNKTPRAKALDPTQNPIA